MEKRIIPVTLRNNKLRPIISEIIESNNIFGNLEFQLTDKNDLNKNDKSILIAGFGRIGKKLISRCLAFNTKVYIYDPYVDEKIIKEFCN